MPLRQMRRRQVGVLQHKGKIIFISLKKLEGNLELLLLVFRQGTVSYIT